MIYIHYISKKDSKITFINAIKYILDDTSTEKWANNIKKIT